LVADILGKPIKSLPERGRLKPLKELKLHVGGCAVNTGITLARLGVKTEVIGMVGEDSLGDFIIETLKGEGIETRNIKRTSCENTSITMVMISKDGERSFLHYIGANGELKVEDISLEAIKESKLTHIGGTFLMPKLDGEGTKRILRKAKKLGKTTSLDTAWDITERWLEVIDIGQEIQVLQASFAKGQVKDLLDESHELGVG
jgi:sugar/nucleoside kinase (ribokinase family)